jgi:hypothetical protein
MKKLFPIFVLVAACSLTGCALFRHKPAPKAAAQNIVTPDAALAAKVISVNTVGRFVVLNFPSADMPKLQQTLFLYRAGLKTAEVKVTGPQSENNIVADLVSGEAQAGDTVRDQ